MQNPPPGEQSTGSPYNATPPPTAPKSSTGLEPNIAAALSYIWIVGLIFFIIEKENRFIRFHALQSIIYGVVWIVLVVALVVLQVIIMVVAGVASSAAGDAGALIGLLISLIAMLIWLVLPLAFLGTLILAAVKAYQGKTFKLPIIGNMAERMVNK